MAGPESQCDRQQARPSSLSIVPPGEIPVAAETPIDNLVVLYKLGLDMLEVCVKKAGKGLSAVQVGVPYDMFVVRMLPSHIQQGNDNGIFVRCSYTPVGVEEKVDSREGCLSLLDASGAVRFYKVKRFPKVRVRGFRLFDDLELRLVEVDYILDLKHDAIVFQHEIDHHDGILISQIGEEILVW
jgi:peptide deformylase